MGGAAAFGDAINEFLLPMYTNDKKSDDAQYLTPPEIELDVSATRTDEDQCQKEPGSQAGQVSFPLPLLCINFANRPAYLISAVSQQKGSNGACDATTMQIIWPVGCQRTSELTAVENVLKKMDSGLITSKDSRCPGAEGVFFWSGAFTTYQSDFLMEKYKGVISAIEPNVRMYKQTQSRVKKYPPTDSLLDTQKSLNFISTAPGSEDSSRYAYFFQERWAFDVTLFIFDDEYEEASQEFQFSDITMLSAAGADKAPAEDKSGHGTCLLSAALGDVYGVAKRLPRVIFTKVRLHLDSLLDGLESATVRME